MKVSACDICLTEGKITKAGWVSRLRSGVETIRLHICTDHKGLKMDKPKMIEIGFQASGAYLGMRG